MDKTLDIHPYGKITLKEWDSAADSKKQEEFIIENWEVLAGYAYIHYREKGGGALLLQVDEREIHYVTRDDDLYGEMVSEQTEEFLRLYDPELQFVIVIHTPGKRGGAHSFRYGAKNMSAREASERIFGSLLGGI